mmetsp:Transcript_3543/g.10101  ORF Transcript_3543/g.10101 Transcript_3543/m.10101 type:complete len:253 (+) Transcript_3543:249-1007(+)
MARHSSKVTISQSKSVAWEWWGSKSADSPLNHAVTCAGITGKPCAWQRQSDVVGGPGRSAPLTAKDRRHFFNHARGTRRYAPGLKRADAPGKPFRARSLGSRPLSSDEGELRRCKAAWSGFLGFAHQCAAHSSTSLKRSSLSSSCCCLTRALASFLSCTHCRHSRHSAAVDALNFVESGNRPWMARHVSLETNTRLLPGRAHARGHRKPCSHKISAFASGHGGRASPELLLDLRRWGVPFWEGDSSFARDCS